MKWQITEAVMFFHDIGILLYFAEEESGMNEVIITDPQKIARICRKTLI